MGTKGSFLSLAQIISSTNGKSAARGQQRVDIKHRTIIDTDVQYIISIALIYQTCRAFYYTEPNHSEVNLKSYCVHRHFLCRSVKLHSMDFTALFRPLRRACLSLLRLYEPY